MDKQPAKNGKAAPKRRVSALQKVAGANPAGSDVGSSLDDFIASANQTLTDTDAFKLTSDISGDSRAAAREKKAKEESAAIEAAAAEAARTAAEEAARMVLAEVTRKSAQQMAQLEAKLAQAEARASSAEKRVRPPRAPSPDLPTLTIEEGPDFAEGSYSKPFGRLDADLLRRRRSAALKIGLAATGAAVVVAGVLLLGNGRLWNKDSEAPAARPVVAAKSEPAPALAAPTPAPLVKTAALAPAVSALPAAEPSAAVEARPAAPEPKVESVPEPKVEPAPEPKVEPRAEPLAQAPAAGQAPVPMVSTLAPIAPTVTPLDAEGDAPRADRPARKSSNKKKKARASKARGKSAKKAGSSGGIVDPFAQ